MILPSDLTHEPRLDTRWTIVYHGPKAVALLEKKGAFGEADCPTLMLFATDGTLIRRTWIGWGNRTVLRIVADWLNNEEERV